MLRMMRSPLRKYTLFTKNVGRCLGRNSETHIQSRRLLRQNLQHLVVPYGLFSLCSRKMLRENRKIYYLTTRILSLRFSHISRIGRSTKQENLMWYSFSEFCPTYWSPRIFKRWFHVSRFIINWMGPRLSLCYFGRKRKWNQSIYAHWWSSWSEWFREEMIKYKKLSMISSSVVPVVRNSSKSYIESWTCKSTVWTHLINWLIWSKN